MVVASEMVGEYVKIKRANFTILSSFVEICCKVKHKKLKLIFSDFLKLTKIYY